jgi:GLPGLI family protein
MRFFLIASLLFLSTLMEAQVVLEGRIRYKVTQNWSKQLTSLPYISEQRRQKIEYMWGHEEGWSEYYNLFFNTAITKFEESDEQAERDDNGYSWRKSAYVLMRDFSKNTRFEVFEMAGKKLVVEDSLQTMEWKVQNELKEVAGHVCMSAVLEDTLKFQTIVAWFALDIPMSGGPEGYYGLPGMILEIDINDGAKVITADKIEDKALTTELEAPKKPKGKKVTYDQYLKQLSDHIAEKKKLEEPWFWSMRY